jgi:hypothetical protein
MKRSKVSGSSTADQFKQPPPNDPPSTPDSTDRSTPSTYPSARRKNPPHQTPSPRSPSQNLHSYPSRSGPPHRIIALSAMATAVRLVTRQHRPSPSPSRSAALRSRRVTHGKTTHTALILKLYLLGTHPATYFKMRADDSARS